MKISIPNIYSKHKDYFDISDEYYYSLCDDQKRLSLLYDNAEFIDIDSKRITNIIENVIDQKLWILQLRKVIIEHSPSSLLH